MLVVKTVKIPVHYGITTHKLSILDSVDGANDMRGLVMVKVVQRTRIEGLPRGQAIVP